MNLILVLSLFAQPPLLSIHRAGPGVAVEASSDLKTWVGLTNIPASEALQFFRASETNTLPYPFLYETNALFSVPWQYSLYGSQNIEPIIDTWGTQDADGIRMFYDPITQQIFNHPVLQGRYALSLLNSYRKTTNTAYLERAENHAQRIISVRVESRGAWFFPYQFDYQIDPTPAPGDMIRAPWFSGMSQGVALSLFCELYRVTGNESYKEAASKTFAAFKLTASDSEPWVCDIDERGCVWFEEYASVPKSHQWVLNGHIFGLWGAFDYYQLTGDTDALRLAQGGIATVKLWFDFFRAPGTAAKYSRAHPNFATSYHSLIIKMCACLWSITHDPFWTDAVDKLRADYPDPLQKSGGTFNGGVNGYKFGPSAEVTSAVSITASNLTVQVASRRTIQGQNGIWLLISGGQLGGYFVRESPLSAQMNCIFQPVEFYPARKVQLGAGLPGYAAYQFDTSGGQLSKYWKAIDEPTELEFDQTAVINSRLCLHIISGFWSGCWLPLEPYRMDLE